MSCVCVCVCVVMMDVFGDRKLTGVYGAVCCAGSIVHDARVDLLTAVMLGTFSRNLTCEADMRNTRSLRQAEVAHCLHKLGVSNSWVWKRLNCNDNRGDILRRSRLPWVSCRLFEFEGVVQRQCRDLSRWCGSRTPVRAEHVRPVCVMRMMQFTRECQHRARIFVEKLENQEELEGVALTISAEAYKKASVTCSLARCTG